MLFSKKNWILLCLIGISFFMSAQETSWYQNKPIKDIQFENLEHINKNELSPVLRQYINKPYSDALLWEIQGKLYALEYFVSLNPSALPVNEDRDSLIIKFKVKERPIVDDIIIRGNSKIRTSELLSEILLKKGDIFSKTSLKNDEEAIRRVLNMKGFVDAVLDSVVDENDEDNTVTLTLTITEGWQTNLREIVFQGNTQFQDNALKKVMSSKVQSLLNNGSFQENELQEDLIKIKQYYWDRGFVDADVVKIDKQFEKDEEKNRNYLTLILNIEEGNKFIFSGYEIEGNKLFSTDELTEKLILKEGSVFNYTRFQTDMQSVADRYYDDGYIMNSVRNNVVKDVDGKSIKVVISIIEKERSHIENILIHGNTKTKDHVILRELSFEEGDVFNKQEIQAGLYNLYNTQYFSNLDIQPTEGSTEGLMDLSIAVEEGRTADISFGIAFSGAEDFPVSGQVKWQDRNFGGIGQTIGVESNFSPTTQNVALSFTESYLFGRKMSGSASLKYEHTNESSIAQDILFPVFYGDESNAIPDPYDGHLVDPDTGEPSTDSDAITDYAYADEYIPSEYQMTYESHEISLGLSTGYRWYTPIGRFLVSSGLVSGIETKVYDPEEYRPYDEAIRDALNEWRFNNRVWIRCGWDTRDIVYSPTKGAYLTETLSYAGGVLQGESDYIKSVTRLDIYQKLFEKKVSENFTFSSVAKLHSAFSTFLPNMGDMNLNGSTVGIDGMFIGRGWTGITRGQALWDNSLQLSFPIIERVLAFDVFLDAAAVYTEYSTAKEVSLEDFYYSLGYGIHLTNSQFPIGLYAVKRFKYEDGSINWDPDENGELPYNMDLVITFSIDIY